MKQANIKGFDVIEAPESTFDEVPAIVEQANAQAIGGHTDWVCPDAITLLALQKIAPVDGWVWSSSPYVGNGGYAWGVGFYDGYVNFNYRGGNGRVRLVRASQLLDLGAAVHRASIEAAGIVVPEPANTMQELRDRAPVTLYHATTQKMAKLYRDTGHIKAPVRGFTTEQAAMAWAMKVGRTVVLEFTPTSAHKLPDHHNKFGEAWWNGDVYEWRCTFSAHGDA